MHMNKDPRSTHQLCSPLEQIQELTCPLARIWMPCLRAHLLPGRQGMEPSSLQEETEGQRQLLPHHSIQPESCVAPPAWKAPLLPRVGDEHLASISSWLGSSSQHLLSRSISMPAIFNHTPLSTQLSPACSYPQQGSQLCGVPHHADGPGAGFEARVQARPTSAGDTAE